MLSRRAPEGAHQAVEQALLLLVHRRNVRAPREERVRPFARPNRLLK